MSEAVTAGRNLRAPFPWFGDALAFALECVRGGLLRVDPDGSVWRVAVLRAGTAHAVTPRRAESAGAKGYLRIVLGVSGRKETCSVGAHRLVYAALVGPIPDGLQINHRDLNKRNNDPRNLEVVTGAENIRHSYANGRPRPWAATRAAGGTWRGKPLVSAESIATARAMRAGGALLREVAAHLALSVTHTQRLIAGGA